MRSGRRGAVATRAAAVVAVVAGALLVGCSSGSTISMPSRIAADGSPPDGVVTASPGMAPSPMTVSAGEQRPATTPPPVTLIASQKPATLKSPSASPRSAPPRPTTAPPTTAPPPALPASAYVDVSVATLWHSPSSPRSVDAAAIKQPAGVRSWLGAMSLSQRRALNGRVDSQLILGERVVVDRIEGSWARVVTPDQPTPLDSRGYPGWIPVAQLSFRPPIAAAHDAVVTRPTTWLYIGGAQTVEVSMATRLPVVSADGGWVRTQTPDGTVVSVQTRDVAIVAHGAAAFAATSADVVRTGHLFDGLPYLWGGTSGFGFDCSGFTHLVYAMRGVTIPRDADAQARAGAPVARADLKPGDLVFFATNGFVHHVGIYLGNDAMLNAPQTGSTVSVVSLAAQPFASEYAGARRYLP